MCINAAGQDFLLEEPGTDWNCYCEVALNTVLTGQDLLGDVLKVYGALSTGTLAAADTV